MATEIVFDAATKLTVPNVHPADLAHLMEAEDQTRWAGSFLCVDLKGNGMAWINPRAISYLTQQPD